MYASKFINPATVKAPPFGKGMPIYNTGFTTPKSEPYTYKRAIEIQRNDKYFNFPNSLAPSTNTAPYASGQTW